jgi:hypothetical protein
MIALLAAGAVVVYITIPSDSRAPAIAESSLNLAEWPAKKGFSFYIAIILLHVSSVLNTLQTASMDGKQ